MKINDKDIARMARRMRDEENGSLHVRRWRRNRKSMPQWLVALPAAAVIGFLAGFFTGSKSEPEDMRMLSQRIDTLYITRQAEKPESADSGTLKNTGLAIETKSNSPGTSARRDSSKSKYVTGLPASKDGIRYDMLVMQ